MSNFYGAVELIGGITGYLDAIDGAQLSDRDGAVVITADTVYHYVLDADSGAEESSPDVILPDSNPGTKRWVLIGLVAKSAVFTSIVIKNSEGEIMFYADDDELYFTSSQEVEIANGMPIGLLLALTYKL